ncbi:MAG: PAS domain S-box protein [Spirochaetota bacterium]
MEREAGVTTICGRLLDIAPAPVIVVDRSGAIVRTNAPADTLFGLSRGDIPGLPLSRLFQDGEQSPFMGYFARYLAGATPPGSDPVTGFRGRGCDGRAFDMDIAVDVFPGVEDLYILVIFDRSDAVCRPEESMFLAQASVERSSDTIVWLDSEARIIYVNRAGCDRLGYTREELLGMTIHEVDPDFPPEAWPPHVEEIRRVGSMTFESRHRSKDGVVFPVEVTCNYFEHGGRFYSFAFNRDISGRRKIEEALKLTQFSVDRASDNLVWLDEEANLIYVNDAACSSLGYTREELLSMKIHEIDPDFPPEAWLPHIDELRKRGSITFESRHRAKDGRVFPVEITGNYIEYNGRFYSFAFDRDITERKRVQAELESHRLHLEELVAERTEELHRAMDQLVQSEKLAALGQLVAGVAHELNTPLGNTRMVASALGEDLRAFAGAFSDGTLLRSQLDAFLERSRQAVDLLESNAARAADLIAQFKQVAVDQTSVRRRRFNLLRTVEDLLGTMQPQFRHSGHRVEIDISPDIEMDSYPGPLGQVIANLIGNSLSHGFTGGVSGIIRIGSSLPESGALRIDISDNGKGIPGEVRGRIFEPFFTTRLGQGGSGLGLYIVYNLVTGVLGGSIAVSSGPGEGAAFALHLPLEGPEKAG